MKKERPINMNFKKRPIQYQGIAKKFFGPRLTSLAIILVIFILLITGITKIVKGIDIKKAIFSLGSDLNEDSFGHTNILLLGVGGAAHDGGDLTDSIMVANLDEKTSKVSLLSLPRDLFINEKELGGGMRINNIYFAAKKELKSPELALQLLQKKVEEVLDISIQYYAKIDFSGFEKLIDEVHGIDLYIQETINDPLYPKDETDFYETFFITQGLQHMNGKTALKYARSRHTSSDFSRSERQHAILYALKEKMQKENIMTDGSRLEEMYNILKANIETDLSIREMISLAETGMKIDKKNIGNYLIHDDPSRCGGFLYTPDREFYGGAFVFITAGNSFEPLQKLTNIIFNTPHQVPIHILNGTKKPFLAAKTKVIFNRNCMNVVRYGNGRNLINEETRYYRKADTPEINGAIATMQEFVPGKISDQIPPEYQSPPYSSEAQIILDLGNDYLQHELKDPFDYLPAIKKEEDKKDTDKASANTSESTTTQVQ